MLTKNRMFVKIKKRWGRGLVGGVGLGGQGRCNREVKFL